MAGRTASVCRSVDEKRSARRLEVGIGFEVGHALPHRLEQFLRAEWFAQAVGGAELGRKAEIVGRRRLSVAEHEARHRDDRHAGTVLVERMDRFDPVHARHEDVANDQIERAGFDRRNAGTPICHKRHVVAVLFEHHLDRTAHSDVVIHHQDSQHGSPLALTRAPPPGANQFII